MKAVPGYIENGEIKLKHPIPPKDGTSVRVLFLPKNYEESTSEDLFGKWDWYTDDINQDIKNAWSG